jgi:putative ABC transport system permease protein
MRELSIRMALGARATARRCPVRFAPKPFVDATGIAIGIGAAIAGGRGLAALLFGIGAADITTYVGLTTALLAVATLAAYLPARRAARSDPMTALRAD